MEIRPDSEASSAPNDSKYEAHARVDSQDDGAFVTSPTPMDSSIMPSVSASESKSMTPLSAPTPLAPTSNSAPMSTASSAAVSRGSSIRSVHPPSSSASTTRIRKGLLSRAGSEAEDRAHRHASGPHPMTTDDDEDETFISDSGPMPRRFASQNRGQASAISNQLRPASQSSLSPTHFQPRAFASSASSQHSGNRSGSGDNSEGGSSLGAVSLGRAMSVSSVSSVNSTSSLEAAPFREAPLGNVRYGFGRGGSAGAHGAYGRSPRSSQVGGTFSPSDPSEQGSSQLASSQPVTESLGRGGDDLSQGLGLAPPPIAGPSLSTSAPVNDRHKGVPKPNSDAWMYRVGPGMRTGKARGFQLASTASSSSSSQDLSTYAEESPSLLAQVPTPSKRSRDALRQKFAKGAGRLGIKTNIANNLGTSAPSDYPTAYNPQDSSSDEALNTLPSYNRTPLPRSSSYFGSAPHSAGTMSGALPHPSLTPVPGDFRTSSVTNAPLFVPKFPDEALLYSSSGPNVAASSVPGLSMTRNGPVPSSDPSASASAQPLTTTANLGSSSDAFDQRRAAAISARRRSSVTQKPVLLRSESSTDALDRVASPGLKVDDPSAADAQPAEPALYTLSTSASTNRASRPSSASVSSSQRPQARPEMSSPHPTPAELVRMEAQAGIASLPDSPSEPSPVPAEYSPVTNTSAVPSMDGLALGNARLSREDRLNRRASGSGSDASSATGRGQNQPARRPDSLTRQRLWSNSKRPVMLRARTSENSISRLRTSSSVDRHSAGSSRPHSPAQDAISASEHFEQRDGYHSKNNSGSTSGPPRSENGDDHGHRYPPQVPVIHEDEAMAPAEDSAVGSSPLIPPDRSLMRTPEIAFPSGGYGSAGSTHDAEMGSLSPPLSTRLLPSSASVQSTLIARSVSPASQLARSPETIRNSMSAIGGASRMAESLYGRSPASLTNLRSPLLQPIDRPRTPSSRPSSTASGSSLAAARGPNDFHFGDTLGEGSYSTVLEAWDLVSGPNPKELGAVDPNATPAAVAMVGSDAFSRRRKKRQIDLTGRKAYAIKVLDKVHILKQGKQKYVSVEKEALSRLIRHPGVVTLFWTFQDRESLYFVLELANNGELLSFIRKYGSFDTDSARFYAAQLAETIHGMHTAGVVHRDVKPENILLDSKKRIKVTDFGTAKIVHAPNAADSTMSQTQGESTSSSNAPPSVPTPRAASFVGTAEYVSPELLVEKAQPAGKPADWWAFGCVLFQMLAGRPPFKGVNEYQTLQKVKNREFSFPDAFPEDAKDLIDKVLVLEPSQRLGADQVKAHPFFQGIEWSKLWEVEVPEIKSGIVPAPPPVNDDVAGSSDFSFDEGFVSSSQESQAYGADTQSIVSGHDESSLRRGTSSGGNASRAGNYADDSDLSQESDGEAFQRDSVPTSRSGIEAVEAMPRAPPNSSVSKAPAARRRLSALSIEGSRNMNPMGFRVGATDEAASTSRNGGPIHQRRPSVTTQKSDLHSASAGPQPRNQPSNTALRNSGSSSVQQGWQALLLPKELMMYSVPVIQKKVGTGKMFTKRRQLVITDFPRLLCVKETATALKVKSEVIIAIPAGSQVSGSSQVKSGAGGGGGGFEKVSGGRQSGNLSNEDGSGPEGERSHENGREVKRESLMPNLLTGVDHKTNSKMFTVRTNDGKNYTYETLVGADAGNLVKAIQDVRGRR